MRKHILIFLLSFIQIYHVEGSPKKTRKRKPDVIALFNFLPELEKERTTRDATYNVLQLFSEEETEDDYGPGSKAMILNPRADNQSLVEQYLKDNSMVDCAAAKMPFKKQALKKAKKAKKWVNKWSAPCKGRTGQFRYPDDCHAFVDCWRGRGKLKRCFPNTLVFNEATQQCDWPRNVRCVTGDLEDLENSIRKSREIDLKMPNCEDYTALGYKCTKFWECADSGEIISSPYDFYGEGLIDARMVPPKKKSKQNDFDPLDKICQGQFEICCKGECKANARKAKAKKAKRKTMGSNSFCPGDYTGPRPIPGICTKFAECYKGTAIVKNCPPGTHFCIHSNLCDWPNKAVCNQLETFEEATTQTTNVEPASLSPVHVSQTASDESQQPKELATLYGADFSFLARSQKIIPAPPSGQTVRLRHGKSPSEGYLEIFSFDKWGYVCDSGSWTMEEADVVCKQLGLKRGVRKTTQGLIHGKVDETRKGTENVKCSGDEGKVEECTIAYEAEGKPCKLSEDIVSIACVPDSWATCKKGEIPFGNSCYSFYPNGTSFHKAQEDCKRDGKVLVEIETQEENDMLSELLFQNSKVTNIMNQVWTGGVGSNIARKNVWFWHSDTDKIMDYRNFWKGWSGGDRVDRASLKYSKAIKLSRAFPFGKSRKKKNKQFTDYYFWALEDFSTNLPFICERQQLDIGCREGDGEDYMGDASRTRYGDECMKWDSPEVGLWFDRDQISKLGPLEGNNRCRNPDGESAPWCLTGNGEYENCDIPSCQKQAFALEPRLDAVAECASDQYQCTPGECIFSAYVCDGDIDCSNAADEAPNARCDKYEDEFKKVTNVKLVDEEVEQWTNRNLEACLRLCINAKDFTCRGVNHDPKENVCVLLETNVGILGTLEETFNWNYFERIETQVTCSEDLMCETGKCLNSSQFCNGLFDCPDKKDEYGCKGALDVEVRLVDGKTHNEGRIEIKGYEHDWGGVCDDGFGIQEANVFCRQAGFKLGAREAVLLSRFGNGNGQINLDEVDCNGNEESVLECKFNPWTENDCSLKEFAGVVCIDENRECTKEEWRCKSGECKNLNVLCDTVEDCDDGSDEESKQCDEEIDVRLVGGNNATSGRVEVKYHGVWGTICDDEFGNEEGSVVCRMLGLPSGVKIHKEAAFGEGEGPIWIKTMECWGNETSLLSCPAATWEPNYYCKHMEDVGIECLLSEPVEYDVESSENDEYRQGRASEICGIAEFEFKPSMPIAKVAGGQTASPGSQPWTSSIRVKGNTRSFHWCGAIFVAEFYFLTAAHCVEDYPKDVYTVRVGDWDQDVEDIDEQEFSIQSVHFHPEFNVGAYLNNDIAVIRIKPVNGKGVKVTSRVKPACLPTLSTSYKPGMECTISGWGSLGQGSGGYSRRLQAATVPILETSKCIQKHVYGPDKLTSGMFCAGFLSGGIDSCQGDSGGPMVCNIRGKNHLLGVISWGYGCGRANKPGVYTRVANYLDWIEEIFKA